MARPERNSIDYFPFYCEDGKKMYYLEETYGNDGFATFVKLLRELAKTEYHYLDLSKNTTMMFLSSKCKVSKEVLESIIKDLVDLEKFDRMLWYDNNIIWCQDFIDSIQDAYSKRKNNCITYDGLLLLLVSLGVRKPIKSNLKVGVKPQSIVKDIKEDKIKLNETDILGLLLPIHLGSFYSWLEYRKEIKKEITNLKTLDALVESFNKVTKECADYVVNHSISNNYQGLFWDSYKGAKPVEINNPNNEKIITFHSNIDRTRKKLPESEFLLLQERMMGGGYIYTIVEDGK